jgi:DinB superfamily
MFASTATRSGEFAGRFEAAQDEFIHLIESLDDEQWQLVGKNYPQRVNEEDERRTVGVIAHHVATSGPFILERIQLMVAGKLLPPVGDFRELNARHAADNAGVTRDEVLSVLRETKGSIAAAVRAIPDDQLDQQRETPVGPMSVAQRLERVLIGHVKMHQGSIEAALAR